MTRFLCLAIILIFTSTSYSSPVLKPIFGPVRGAQLPEDNQNNTQYLLYLGAFKIKENAEVYQKEMTENTDKPIHLKYSDDGFYVVYIGPIKHAKTLRATSKRLMAPIVGTYATTKHSLPKIYRVITLSGGPAIINANSSQIFTGEDNNTFIYKASNHNKSTGFMSGLLGMERTLPYPGYLMQVGIEYTYFERISQHGQHTVGIEPATSTSYQYSAQLQTQQALLLAKIFSTLQKQTSLHGTFHPYLLGGIGMATNHLANFITSTAETGSLNLTPTFRDNRTSKLSYSLGAGLETHLDQHIRFGLGYRFTDAGRASFSDGRIRLDNTDVPVSFNLNLPHIYANLISVQLSYLA